MQPTLMLLPGLMCDAAVWAPQVAALQAQARCVVPAWGLRDSLTAMAQQVLETAPAERFHLAGHSMGGRVALEVMRLAPQRVQRLALLDTGTHPLAAGEAGAKERAGRMALLELARSQGMRAMGRQWARGMVHPSQQGTPLFESILDMIERSNPDQFAAQINALLNRPDAAALLPTIQCPTLVLCGRDDAWSTPAQHEAMHTAIPRSTLTIVEHCGHMCTMEQPQALNDALVDWLGQGGA
jgi:pimeloyl-ACP methyl ester carboxylesterase